MRRHRLLILSAFAVYAPSLATAQFDLRSAGPQAVAWDGKGLWTIDQDAALLTPSGNPDTDEVARLPTS